MYSKTKIKAKTVEVTLVLTLLRLPHDSGSKESACNEEDPGSIPKLGIVPEEVNGYPLQYSCLENFMDRGAW